MTMGGEDFSYFLAEKPGCMVFVGSRPPGGELFPHHHPAFDVSTHCYSLWLRWRKNALSFVDLQIDERALLLGPSFLVELIEQILGPEAGQGGDDVTMELPKI